MCQAKFGPGSVYDLLLSARAFRKDVSSGQLVVKSLPPFFLVPVFRNPNEGCATELNNPSCSLARPILVYDLVNFGTVTVCIPSS